MKPEYNYYMPKSIPKSKIAAVHFFRVKAGDWKETKEYNVRARDRKSAWIKLMDRLEKSVGADKVTIVQCMGYDGFELETYAASAGLSHYESKTALGSVRWTAYSKIDENGCRVSIFRQKGDGLPTRMGEDCYVTVEKPDRSGMSEVHSGIFVSCARYVRENHGGDKTWE